ncbi:hypothetical protein CEP51_014398 [Fusarium floridanum]|uniref:Uncharacterized protein n=1 Tax=Fusarium floridanum TaxID=1325733 RepID=A0A428PTH9_9HYPO|nr:hypothetical protein CEP51_014398 [Fusarium floridanum]
MPPLLIDDRAENHALQVICAWPVSGQYGFGTRILYYVLIATCLLARREDWLVTPCLAAALVLPAVAAFHGIVLAAFHNPHAVDMDVFGAFQLCSIGIIVAPVTVMMSRTYFNDPGRNTIFLWTFLQLVGLLSLAIEFYRIQTSDCMQGNSQPLPSSDVSHFPYTEGNNCGLICSIQEGPSSPMRGGSANNIYVIPAPGTLTFGTATLLAAACSIHAVLCLVSMWDKVVETNWKKHYQNRGTKGMIKRLNQTIGYFLKILAVPVFGGAGLAILIVGEINFFSAQVRYQTEPMANVGQWAPVVGTSLAMLTSLYILLAKHIAEGEDSDSKVHRCNCSHCKMDHTRDEIIPTRELDAATDHPLTNLYRQKVKKLFFTVGKILGTPHQDYITARDIEAPSSERILVPGQIYRDPTLSERLNERGRWRGDDSPTRVRASSFGSSVLSSSSMIRTPSMPEEPQAAVLPPSTRSRTISDSLDPEALATFR